MPWTTVSPLTVRSKLASDSVAPVHTSMLLNVCGDGKVAWFRPFEKMTAISVPMGARPRVQLPPSPQLASTAPIQILVSGPPALKLQLVLLPLSFELAATACRFLAWESCTSTYSMVITTPGSRSKPHVVPGEVDRRTRLVSVGPLNVNALSTSCVAETSKLICFVTLEQTSFSNVLSPKIVTVSVPANSTSEPDSAS